MESSRTYRDTRGRDIRLPREVYYRCLWTLRDTDRLKSIAAVLDHDDHASEQAQAVMQGRSPSDGCSGADTMIIAEDVARRAAAELDCIERALDSIPQVYREGLLDNILHKEPLPDFAHANTWKRWKLVLMYEMARELRLI